MASPGFTIKNNDTPGIYTAPGGDKTQAIWFQADIDALIAGLAGYYVLDGCAGTPPGGMVTRWAAGTIVVGDGAPLAVTQADVTHDAADATLPRRDLVWRDELSVGLTTGVPASNPDTPAFPAGKVALGWVLIRPAVSAIAASDIDDRRVIRDSPPVRAVGSGVSPDRTLELQVYDGGEWRTVAAISY